MQVGGASVLLTGGSRGLGTHIARALVRRGARVTLAARSAEDLEEVRRSLGEDRAAPVAGDVTRPEDRARMVAVAEEAFGPVDVLVNNAAVVRAIEDDKPDVVVAGMQPQLSDVVLALSPRLFSAAARRSGGYEPMRRNAEAEVARRKGSA
jgi:NAD(P)-dependent dehydrogenase (short-subunit alcohol dehydrogenase family)